MFKAGKHSKWDLDYEISFWKKREAKLIEDGEGGEVPGELSTPRAESPKTTDLVQR